MGFSIWVADDPELEDEEASDYPYFSTSNAAMAFLRFEMEAQGMLALMPSSDFVFNNGDYVPGDELSAALAVAGRQPMTADDDEARELWPSWLDFLQTAIGHGGIRVY